MGFFRDYRLIFDKSVGRLIFNCFLRTKYIITCANTIISGFEKTSFYPLIRTFRFLCLFLVDVLSLSGIKKEFVEFVKKSK